MRVDLDFNVIGILNFYQDEKEFILGIDWIYFFFMVQSLYKINVRQYVGICKEIGEGGDI